MKIPREIAISAIREEAMNLDIMIFQKDLSLKELIK
jgi:hypothetical protein